MGNLELSVFLVIFSCTTVFTANTNTTNPTTIQASFSLTNTSTNTASETRNSTTTPKTAPLTSKPTENCAIRNLSCGECVQDADCYWCEADDTCKRYPSLTKVIPRDCEGNTWFWKQCVMAGFVLIYVIPGILFVVLLILGCCIYCLCCRNHCQRSRGREERKFGRKHEEIKQRYAQRRAERKMKTEAIRQKYGLLSNEDDAEVA